MALPVESFFYGKMVSGSDPAPLYDLVQASNAGRVCLDLLWLSFFWLGGAVLDGGDPAGLLPSYAGLRKQFAAPSARPSAGSGFQPQHLVAGPASANGVG